MLAIFTGTKHYLQSLYACHDLGGVGKAQKMEKEKGWIRIMIVKD